MMLDYSLGETEALATRAGRGAGLSWGQAQEAGRAVTRLAAMGLPAPDCLAGLLPRLEATPYAERCPVAVFDDANAAVHARWSANGAGLCPIAVGCSFADVLPILKLQKASEQFAIIDLWSPMLMTGILLPAAADAGFAIRLRFGTADLLIANQLLFWRGDWAAFSAQSVPCLVVTVQSQESVKRLSDEFKPLKRTASRCLIDTAVVSCLQTFAIKTYVPATAQGRMAGAGAGLKVDHRPDAADRRSADGNCDDKFRF